MFIGLIHAVQHQTGEVLPQNVATGLYGERQVLFWGGGSQPKPPFPPIGQGSGRERPAASCSSSRCLGNFS